MATILGTKWADELYGGPGFDVVRGQAGDDILHANGSGPYGTGDSLYGDSGNDILYGADNYGALYGGIHADTLYGGTGSDLLDGGAGADLLVGGTGNDYYQNVDADDVIVENVGEGQDYVSSKVTFSLGLALEDLTLLGTANINGYGNDLDNYLSGNAGANVLEGFGGRDLIYAGAGDDTLYGGAGNDSINGAAGDDHVYGGDGNDNIGDYAGHDYIDGGAGDDQISLSYSGSGEVYGGDGVDKIWVYGYYGPGLYKVDGGEGADNISVYALAGSSVSGGGGDDFISAVFAPSGSTRSTVEGGDGDDVIHSAYGNTTFYGGAGIDVFNLAQAGNTGNVIADFQAGDGGEVLKLSQWAYGPGASYARNPFAAGFITLVADGGDTLLVGDFDAAGPSSPQVFLRLTGVLPSELTAYNFFGWGPDGTTQGVTKVGGDGTDLLAGTYGNDTLYGGDGADSLSGSFGDDVLYGGAGADNLGGGEGANVLYGGDGADTFSMYGDSLPSAAYGGDGDDIIYGGSLNTTMDGGAGNDRFYYTNGTITTGTGADRIQASASGRLTVTDFDPSSDVVELENYLWAYYYWPDPTPVDPEALGFLRVVQDGADVKFEVDENGLKWKVDYKTVLTLQNVDAAQLNASNVGFNFTLLYRISGDDGDDLLYSTTRGEMIDGHGGNNTVSYAAATGGVTVRLNPGDQQTGHGLDSLSNIQNIVGSGFADTLIGDATGNRLDGGDGNDTLAADDGADTLSGGAGDDILSGGNGADLLDGGLDNDKLDGGADNDTLFGGAGEDELKGRTGDDKLVGGDGADRLDGGEGADTMSGGVGNDIYTVDAEGDVVDEAAPGGGDAGGTDQVNSSVSVVLPNYVENLSLSGGAAIDGTGNGLANKIAGNAGNNVLIGLGGADVLAGGGGDDTLIGGAGIDQLTGGAGADIFVFSSLGDFAGSAADQVTDFSRAQGDRLDLAGIDANLGLDGDQAFTFIGSAAFSHTAGELRFVVSGANLTILGDVNGDGVADFAIRLAGVTAIEGADFLP